MNEQTMGYGPLFSALADPRRRALVLLLAIAPAGSLALATAAELIAIFEDGPRPDTQHITNVRTSLKRSHTNLLETTHVIESRANRFGRGPRFGAAIRAIAHAAEGPQAEQTPVSRDRSAYSHLTAPL